VIFLAILTVFFYLDRRRIVVWLCVLFAVSNTALSWWSIALGPSFYGYGFAISLFLCVMAGLVALNRTFNKLEYSTFMLQA
jgi:polysaccharide biosynthesis protein PelG